MSMSTPLAMLAVLFSAVVASTYGCAGPDCNTTVAAEQRSSLRGAGLMAAGAADQNTSSAAWALVQREMEETGCCCHTNDRWYDWPYTKSGCCTCESCAQANEQCAQYCSDNPPSAMKQNAPYLNTGGVCCPPSQYKCHETKDWYGNFNEFFCTAPGCDTSSSMKSHCHNMCGDDCRDLCEFCWNEKCQW